MADAAAFSIVPETLNVTVCKGDEFGMSLTFTDGGSPMDLSGYSFSAAVFETTRSVTAAYPGGIYTRGADAEAIAITVVDAANGELNLALTETQTETLSETTTYRWALIGVAPGTITRTYISGKFTIQSP